MTCNSFFAFSLLSTFLLFCYYHSILRNLSKMHLSFLILLYLQLQSNDPRFQLTNICIRCGGILLADYVIAYLPPFVQATRALTRLLRFQEKQAAAIYRATRFKRSAITNLQLINSKCPKHSILERSHFSIDTLLIVN